MSTRVLVMHKAYARTQDGAGLALGPVLAHPPATAPAACSHGSVPPGFDLPRPPCALAERLADPVFDRRQLELGAGDILQQLVRGGLVAQGPQLAQERAGLTLGEPVASE